MRQFGTAALDLLRSCLAYAVAFWLAFVAGVVFDAMTPHTPDLPPGTEVYYTWSETGWAAVRTELWNWSYGLTFFALAFVIGALAHVAVRLAERAGWLGPSR